jgi:hypothetical protein
MISTVNHRSDVQNSLQQNAVTVESPTPHTT